MIKLRIQDVVIITITIIIIIGILILTRIVIDEASNTRVKLDQQIQPVILTDFVLESKIKIKIPELEDCTLYTLINESTAYPIRLVRCTNSITTQVNDRIITIEGN